jgi:hypothetical protein
MLSSSVFLVWAIFVGILMWRRTSRSCGGDAA